MQPLRRVGLVQHQVKTSGSRRELLESWSELEAVLEKGDSGEDVEAESGTRHGHDQTAHIPQVTHGFGSDERKEDVVVLLTLVLIHCGHFVRSSNQRIPRASCVDDIADEMLLTVVGCEDGYFAGWIT